MKIRLFSHRAGRDLGPGPKPTPVAPAPRHMTTEPTPRVWSLLLPPGYSNDGR
jgi:hypothetical protein